MSVGRSVISGSVSGVDRLAFAFKQGIPASVRTELRRAVDRLAVELQRKVKQDYLSGSFQTGIGRAGALNVRTGTLRRSINLKREDTPTEVTTYVGTNVIYGAAWERGNVKNWRGQVQPARPFLRPAWEEMQGKIHSELTKAVGFALRKGMMYGP